MIGHRPHRISLLDVFQRWLKRELLLQEEIDFQNLYQECVQHALKLSKISFNKACREDS